MYSFYLDGILLPVTPGHLETRYPGNNTAVSLIDGGHVTLFGSGEPEVFSFEALLPRRSYPFARYESGFRQPTYYLDRLLALREGKAPFRFIVSRTAQDGTLLEGLNLLVSLEEMTVTEDGADGSDITAALKFRAYREYTAARVELKETSVPIQETPPRETANAPKVSAYTVVTGDCLWNIAKKYLGDGARYTEIYALNQDQIANPSLIYPGQVLVMPSP